MAAVSRQPFAPLGDGRLSGLTSVKNRQNALSTKRKAAEVDQLHDAENVDPNMFSKRAKSSHSNIMKPSQYVLKKSSTPVMSLGKVILGNTPIQPRHILQAKSQQIRLNTRISTPTTLTAPAGRSPTRASKKGARLSTPSFGGVSAPFSLDAALKGTIPTYSGGLKETKSTTKSATPKTEFFEPSTMKSDWFFEIHEDTPEQEMTNLLQHSTCVLDISSDEETEKRETRECAEGRDKENVPPTDDVSQTQTQSARTPSTRGAAGSGSGSDADDMIVEKNRGPLQEMDSQDFWPEGTDDEDFFVVPGDEDDVAVPAVSEEPAQEDSSEKQHADTSIPQIFVDNFEDGEDEADEADTSSCGSDSDEVDSIDGIMGVHDGPVKAAVLEPIEGTGESFELWESESAKDQQSAPSSPVREGVLGEVVEVDIAEC